MNEVSPRILVVEDEPDLVHLLQVNLGIAGYEVTTATTGEEGLEQARRTAPDAMLLDVMLPHMDGWAVLRAVKEGHETRDLPIVMLTALTAERDLIRGHLQGAVEYLTKPFEMKQLVTTLEDVLRTPTPDELELRRQRTRTMLTRLAELDSGRAAETTVRLSGLERAPVPEGARQPTPAERQGLASMTDNQRWLAAALTAGWGARQIAEHMDVSRSNVYATRRRIARRLGCKPGEVAEVGAALELADEVAAPPDS